MLIMQALAGVLLKMQPLNSDGDSGAVFHVEQDFSLTDNRFVELGNLIALRQIGVEIVLAGKDRDIVDFRLEPKPGAHRLCNAFLVDDRQHARHRRIHQADMIVWLAAKIG